MTDGTSSACACGYPRRWAADPDVPIAFDERFNEFNLEGRERIWIMRFCPSCGGRLPESTRDELFLEPDAEEVADMRGLLDGLRTIDELLTTLGPPEMIADWTESPSDKYYENQLRWKRCLSYTNRWRTLNLSILELPDSTFSYTWSGKLKDPSGSAFVDNAE